MYILSISINCEQFYEFYVKFAFGLAALQRYDRLLDCFGMGLRVLYRCCGCRILAPMERIFGLLTIVCALLAGMDVARAEERVTIFAAASLRGALEEKGKGGRA